MITIRKARPLEYTRIGQLMVDVYAALDGFPKPEEQPRYFDMLANVGRLTEKPGIALLVATDETEAIAGALIFVGDMAHYGSSGPGTGETDAAGFRLLAVDPRFRGRGIGRQLALECIRRARELGKKHVIIHSTKAMSTAWAMYERMGFTRDSELDFNQGDLEVFGFRFKLEETPD